MEAVRSQNLGALIAVTSVFAVLLGTVALQQTAISKEKHRMSSVPDHKRGEFRSKGEKAVELPVRTCSVEIDNGSIDCQVATDNKTRVRWEIVSHNGARAELMEVQVSQCDGVLRVTDDWHGSSWARKPEVRVTVWLPEQADLELALGNGDVTTALNGKLSAEVGNGELKLQGAPRQIEVAMGNGHVSGNALLARGDNSVQLGNGHIELQLLKGSDAKVEVTTATGKLEARGLAGQVTSNWVGSSYSGQIGAGTAALELELGHGDVNIQSTDL